MIALPERICEAQSLVETTSSTVDHQQRRARAGDCVFKHAKWGHYG